GVPALVPAADLERGQLDARALLALRLLGQRGGPLRDELVELALGHGAIDEAPVLRALAAHALGEGAEDVGEVAAHPALVDEAGEPTGAREHREERRLRERDRAVAVVRE